MNRPSQPATVLTLTNELFLPTRLIYEVFDVKRLRAWIQATSCLTPAAGPECWTWNYEAAATKLGFPEAYNQVPPEGQPVVLATCRIVNDQTFHVTTRCGLRTVKFLVFFDEQVSRSIAVGKFIDQYNLLTAIKPGAPLPQPEDYFRDEAKIAFFDIIGLMDSPDSPAKDRALADYAAGAAQRTLRPLERHRLDLFYHDGPTEMERAMQYRDLMAMMQQKTDQPIRPAEVIAQLLQGRPVGQ